MFNMFICGWLVGWGFHFAFGTVDSHSVVMVSITLVDAVYFKIER